MKLTIYKGTNEIGGNCIELEQGDTRILLDFGIPLEAMDTKNFDIKDFKPNIKDDYNAVFITHAHPDHYGLLELLNDNTPIYATADTCNILQNLAPLTTKFKIKNLNFNILSEAIQIGNFKITPHDIDHSITGACALEISCNDKTILYTGDIRFHGRCAFKNSAMIKKINKIDYLIMEGTTISRADQKRIKEDKLIDLFVDEFKKEKLPLIQVSAQNIDRFITIYKACLKTKKTLVIDPYTCLILELYNNKHKNIPQYNSNNIKVYRADNSITESLEADKKLDKYLKNEISFDEIISTPEKYVIKGNYDINIKLLKSIKKEKLSIIYSMWKGYLNKPSYLDDFKDVVIHIHTSGHSTVKDLQKFVRAIKPNAIIPIHTECKDRYKELFEIPIIELDNNEVFEI